MVNRWRCALVMGFAMLFSVMGGGTVFAENRLQDIRIEVELQEDGSGVVTEHRHMDMDEGTELFIVLDELQDSELLDFSVAGFEAETDWDSGASRADKAGKYGVVATGNGYELIWGIGEYGENSYEVTYTLSNLVRDLEDGQGLLWNFDTFSRIPAENLTLEVEGPEPFTEENTRLWGFGFEGDIQLMDGRVVWEAFEEVDSRNDVIALLQFPPEYFATTASLDMTLAEQQEMAMAGSAYGSSERESSAGEDANFMPFVVGAMALGAGGIGTAVTYSAKIKKAKRAAGEIQMGNARYEKNEGLVYDAIPYAGGDVAGIAFFLQGIYKGEFEDYFAAYLMKWTEDGRILMETILVDSQYDDVYETTITIQDYEAESQRYARTFAEVVQDMQMEQADLYEDGLWTMLLDAADRTGFVTGEMMGEWAGTHASEVGAFSSHLVDYSKNYLERNGFIAYQEVEVWGRKHKAIVATESGEALLDRLTQFEHYLIELEESEFLEVNEKVSFADMLFWNALYSRMGEVSEQLEAMLAAQNDDYGTGNFYQYYWYWNGMTGFHEEWYSGYHAHSSSSAGSSGSSGFGGSTFSGGGGGAGGGGGGGAR